MQLWKSNAKFNMSSAMYHLFSHPIATHLSRLFIAAVPSEADRTSRGTFLRVLSQKKGSCFVLLSFVAFLWSSIEAVHMPWVINASSFCLHRVLNGRSPVKSVWSQQEVALKTGSWSCSQFCFGSFVSHLTLVSLLHFPLSKCHQTGILD